MVQTGCSWFEILYHHVLDILQLLLKSFFHQYVVKFENFVSSDKSQYILQYGVNIQTVT